MLAANGDARLLILARGGADGVMTEQGAAGVAGTPRVEVIVDGTGGSGNLEACAALEDGALDRGAAGTGCVVVNVEVDERSVKGGARDEEVLANPGGSELDLDWLMLLVTDGRDGGAPTWVDSTFLAGGSGESRVSTERLTNASLDRAWVSTMSCSEVNNTCIECSGVVFGSAGAHAVEAGCFGTVAERCSSSLKNFGDV